MNENYNDIIDRPHHVSSVHRHIPLRDRAAQFSPFAALTGYDAQVKETARLTENKIELDEDRAAHIDACLQLLIENAAERPHISVTFFKQDETKAGGSYITINGSFKMLDESDNTLLLTNGTRLPLADIYAIDSELFQSRNAEETK